MKSKPFRLLQPSAKRLMIGYCILAQMGTGIAVPAPDGAGAPLRAVNANQTAPPAAEGAPTPVKVNRTVPKVDPPKTGLQFSATPTTQEIFRARIFEEPLVPIDGEPTAADNAALAAALLGYSKRSGP